MHSIISTIFVKCSGRFLDLFLITLFSLLCLVSTATGQTLSEKADSDQVNLLLSRLDLNSPQLNEVKKATEEPELAARKLLEYYRSRKNMKHPVDRGSKEAQIGNYADQDDLDIAENALKHIFIGQRAYPPHFAGEDINWNLRPVPDMEWVWQLNRMYFWDAMAKAYWHTGSEEYAREWAAQLIDWTEKNPRDADHQYAWRSIEAGIRGHSWTNFYQHFIDAPSFTPEVLVAFLNSCYDHASYLMTKYSKGSNWGLMEAEGMAFIAITFPEFKESKAWREEAFRRLVNEIDNQVYPDGHQRELAMGYHLGCIRWFSRTYELAKMNDLANAFPDFYAQRIEKMCEVPMKLGYPDGRNVQFGDAWVGQPGQHQQRYEEWAEQYDREDFLFLATNGAKGSQPDSTAYALPHSGLYSMRSSWDPQAIFMALKCGPDGGGHCQPDNGTFSLMAGGRILMPDAGSYIYSGDPEGRAWFRQTKVHQTLTLNGQNSLYDPDLLLWQPGKNLDILVVENKSYPELTHRRAVFFVDKAYFVVVDEAFGSTSGEVDIHFTLAPGDADLNEKALTANSNFNEGWNVMVKTMPQKGIEMTPEEGQVSFVYTKKKPRPAFKFGKQKISEEGVRFITVVAPYADNQPEVSFELKDKPGIGGDVLELNVRYNGKKSQLGYQLKSLN